MHGVWRDGRIRLQSWPNDDAVAHLVVVDQDTVPDRDELRSITTTASSAGVRSIRSGAVFPRAADALADAGFVTLDTLALLQLDLDRAGRLPRVRTRRLWRRQHDDAAAIDRAAFGDLWGNDAAGLLGIRRATPANRARRIDRDHRVAAFSITGVAARTAYLQRLAVHPAHQRHGLGRALVSDAITWAQRRRFATMMVNTGVENAPALALYDWFGFRLLRDQLTVAELQLADDSAPTHAAPAHRDR